MIKNELKTGYRVTTREGGQYIVLLGVVSAYEDGNKDVMVCPEPGSHSWLDLDDYRDNLTIDVYGMIGLDIVKVEKPNHPYDIFYSHEGWRTLWDGRQHGRYS